MKHNRSNVPPRFNTVIGMKHNRSNVPPRFNTVIGMKHNRSNGPPRFNTVIGMKHNRSNVPPRFSRFQDFRDMKNAPIREQVLMAWVLPKAWAVRQWRNHGCQGGNHGCQGGFGSVYGAVTHITTKTLRKKIQNPRKKWMKGVNLPPGTIVLPPLQVWPVSLDGGGSPWAEDDVSSVFW